MAAHLGFSQKNHHEGVYFDGHERDDVVESWQQIDWWSLMKKLTFVMQPQIGKKPLIRVVHDEGTFRYWCDDSQVLKQKSLDSSIMVSDFIDEMDVYLRHDGKEA